MNKKINIKTILIILLILLICSNIALISIYLNNRNSNIEKQGTSKEQLTTISSSNAYIDKSLHLSELNEVYQTGYEEGSSSAYVDAFNYHFKVSIPCTFGFSISDSTRTGTASYYIEYNGGTVTTSTLNSATTISRGSVTSGLQLTNATVVIHEKDKFTANFTIKQTLAASWNTDKTTWATVNYDHGTINYNFSDMSWDSGSYDLYTKSNGNPTVTIY